MIKLNKIRRKVMMTKEKEIIIKQDTNFSNITIELKVKE